jgi:hypothetical protein
MLILDTFGKMIVKGIQTNLDTKGLTNTGQTKASVRYEIKDTTLTVYGAMNLLPLEDGAKPLRNKTGGFIEAITEWAQSKLGLSQKEARGLAFAYMKRRTGKGDAGRTTAPDGSYIVPNQFNVGGVLSDTITPQMIAELTDMAKNEYLLTFKREINQAIRGIK